MPDNSFLLAEIGALRTPDPALTARAQDRLDALTKPRGSLGRLEEIASKLFAIQGGGPLQTRPARVYTIAGDHGVVAEGVASSPQEVTRLMLQNFLRGGAGINALCAAAGAELRVVDAGTMGPEFAPHPLLIRAKIAPGTRNIAQGPAMSKKECLAALALGLRLAEEARADGVRVLGTGEMGIGNTTPSSALFCACMGFSPAEMTGAGAGLSPAGLAHKKEVITRSLSVNAGALRTGDPIDLLAALGGFEIAALTGLIIGGTARRMAVVIDGFISTAAFVLAQSLAPAVRSCCFFSHCSAETGHGKVLERLGEKALLDLGLRLGEGTGAALGMQLLEASARMFNEMASFDDAGICLDPV
ncbi:nicotinate-nucleotide--dimethylbenzimidazole phosphoribosyltransferase [Desulfovibrio sp. OttesenSCG-928-A18]|nr:nicotinate-nucleotide--dimethylbenzimidazole phosphoribosyltransferase [Desulfovibrio sp. OttesenSCG-928-A18]